MEAEPIPEACVEELAALAVTLVPGLAVIVPAPAAAAVPEPLPNPPADAARIIAGASQKTGFRLLAAVLFMPDALACDSR
jgi:hypothetical protein